MFMKRYILLVLLFISVSGYAQNTINNYKYIIVPEKFNILKQNDQYNLNSLTKALLTDKGFTVYYDNADLPTEIANNKCSALTADLLEKNSMFTTNLTLLLKDCQNNIVFKSKEGKSREKEYRVSYNLALRDAFTSMDETKYAYNGATHEQGGQPAVTTTAVASPPAVKTAAAETAVASPEVSATPPAGVSPVVTPPAKSAAAETVVSQPSAPVGTLYAQAIANGYQLIDTTPKIVLTLLKTSVQDYYIASNATANGIVLKKNDSWFFEYYKDGKLTSEKLQVKF